MPADSYRGLACPDCRKSLAAEERSLVCRSCSEAYPIIDEIPVFLSEKDRCGWDGYHLHQYTPIYSGQGDPVHRVAADRTEEAYCEAPLGSDSTYAALAGPWRRMLDLGCGDGHWSASLAGRVPEIYCVDPSLLAIKRLRSRNLPGVLGINGMGDRLPFADGFFDGMFLIFVVEHMRDPMPLLREAHRVLRPGGTMIVSTDSKIYDIFWRKVLEFATYRRWNPKDPTHVNLMTPRQVRRVLCAAGFTVVKNHSTWVFRKERSAWLPTCIREPIFTGYITYDCQANPLAGA
jgi:ubiquinone/menaquinone biosynthesis C-methylase UbiE